MIIVANAGPLIALARIGHFELLRLLYSELSIPTAVQDEVAGSGQSRPGAIEMEAAEWIRVATVENQTAVELLRERLDRGESEAIILAIELEAELLLIDEARGRRVAQAQGLNYIGTVGVLIQARQNGLIRAITPLLDELIASGFRMDEALYRTAQELVNEAENSE